MEFVFAYIDPGSGSLLIQALIAGLVAIPILFRKHVARALSALRGGGAAQREGATVDDEGDAGA